MAEPRDQLLFLEDIILSIEFIEEYLDGHTLSDFETDQEKQDAVVRRLEIIGEAVKHLSVVVKDKDPSIPWKQMAGMSDVVIHQYFGITVGLIWNAAKNDLPQLLPKFKALAADH